MTNERRLGFTPEFIAAFNRLKKKYRNIDRDIQPLLDEIKSGSTPGDRIPGTGYTLFKVRLRNTDAQRGKSGGYRIIYYLQTAEQAFMVTVYSKTEREDISIDELRRIVERLIE